MKITILTHGTRGDVQPFASLAELLEQRGHNVRIAAPINLEPFIIRAGFEYAKIAIDSKQALDSDEGRAWLSSGNVMAFLKNYGKLIEEAADEFGQDIVNACKGSDAIIASLLVDDWALAVAETMDVPLILAQTMPLHATGDFPNIMVTTRELPRFAAHLTHYIYTRLEWSVRKKPVEKLRATLGLPATESIRVLARKKNLPILHMWSRHIVTPPSDWNENDIITGFWRLLPEVRERLGENKVDSELVQWLDDGPAPIYMGFGSMPVLDPSAMVLMTINIANELNARILIGAGWTEVESVKNGLPDNVRIVGNIDHSWLFSKCAALVHHGGAGTTATGIEAGVPTVICSVFADQPFWGTRLEKLGIGAHIPYAKLNQQKLIDKLNLVLQEDVHARSKRYADALMAENGVDFATETICKILTP